MASFEQSTGVPMKPNVHNDGIGIPTLGYGYALIVFSEDKVTKKKTFSVLTDFNDDLARIGIEENVLATVEDKLKVIAERLTLNPRQDQSALITEIDDLIRDITPAEGRELFDTVWDREFSKSCLNFLVALSQ